MIQLWITYPQLTIFKNFLSWEISHTYQNRKYEYMNSTYLSSCFNNHSKSYFINNPTINIRFCTPIPTQGLGFQHIQAVLGYQQGVLLFNSVLTLSTQRGHQIPQVKGLVHKTDPTPPPTHTYSLSLSRCRSQVQIIITCASDWPAIERRFQQPPPWVQLIH